ncbi:hypothetical protein NW759_010522 [Fusarium solani]|nr:hypothetical protein NW759_010522 [Fusarium solani]
MSSSTQHHRPPLQVKPDFEPHRATIRHLYIVEQMKLAQIMTTMEQRHGFRATEKQYKTTLKTWRLAKNVSKQVKESIIRALESRERGGKKTASVKLGGAPVSKEKIGRWRKERAKATSQFDTDHFGAWCEDSEMLDIEFVSEDEYRHEIMGSTGATSVAGMGEDFSLPGSPHIITSANPPQKQVRGGLGHPISRGASDLFSMAIDRFERAWWRVDNLPVPEVGDNENYDLLDLEYQHIDDDDAFWRQPDLPSESSDIPSIGILDSSWGYPGQFSKLPTTASVCGELGVVEATDSTGEDNSCAEDVAEDKNCTQDITQDNNCNCTKSIGYSEDAGCPKDTDRVEWDGHQGLTTSFYRAVSEGDHHVADILINLTDRLGRPFGDSVLLNSLITASIRGYATVVKLLLDLDVPTTNALREAAMAGRPEALPPLLDKGGCRPGALSFASRGQNERSQQDICRLLLDHGADVDEMSSEPDEPEWGPPLLEAAMHNNSGVFKLLLDRGASLDLALKAHRNKRPWAKKSLFSHGKLDDETNDTLLDATKALFLVLREGDTKLAAVLNLCYGANNNDALVIAARYGDEAVAKRLLDGGANPFQPNSNGLSAIEAARKRQRQSLVDLLLGQNREPPPEMSLLRESFALRVRFISQCRKISNVAGRLPAHLAVEAETLSRYFLDYRPAFCSALSSMRGLSVLEAPDNVCSPLAYLCLARAMTDLIRSKAGADFTGEFQDGVHSFFDVLRHGKFKQTNDTLLYEQVVRLAWGVELSQESSSSGSVDENILRMQALAAKLLFQSTQFTESGGSVRVDHHPLLGERVAPGSITQATKGTDPLSIFATTGMIL